MSTKLFCGKCGAFMVGENAVLPVLQRQLDETGKGIENMLNAIQEGIFTTSAKKRLEELEEAKQELEIQILQEDLLRPWIFPEKIRFWLYKFRAGDLQDQDHRQRLVDSFVNAIYLYDDKIVLTFNYKEGSKTVSLKDELNIKLIFETGGIYAYRKRNI